MRKAILCVLVGGLALGGVFTGERALAQDGVSCDAEAAVVAAGAQPVAHGAA